MCFHWFPVIDQATDLYESKSKLIQNHILSSNHMGWLFTGYFISLPILLKKKCNLKGYVDWLQGLQNNYDFDSARSV